MCKSKGDVVNFGHSTSGNDLGNNMDSREEFGPHIDNIVSSANRQFGLINIPES